MISYSIYVIDDEKTIREGITYSLQKEYQIVPFPNAEDALRVIAQKPPDLVLLDIGLPGMNGIEALKEIKKINPEILVIMITAYEDIETVISAMKLDAYDYIVKPLHMDSLEITIKNALETIKLKKEVKALQEEYLREKLPCFIGKSNAIEDIMDFVTLVAKSPDTPILIQGETGTGKELIARAIHYRSPNFKGNLISVNCASIPKDLIESELFGYEKGAFSGAHEGGKKGLLESATKGTLFLDEIGDLSLDAQAKLLRFIEEGEFYKVGGTKIHHIQTRIVSATNKNLENMVENETFRSDLYFRLGVITIDLPSLNERPDDILPLAKHFLHIYNQKFVKNFTGFTKSAIKVLLDKKWIGNVRELRNIIERAVLTGLGQEITPENLGLYLIAPRKETEKQIGLTINKNLTKTGIDLPRLLNTLESNYIKQALSLAEDNESKAASLVNMNHHTFRYRRKKLNVE